MDYPSLSLSVESIQNVLKQHKLESIPPCDTVKHECKTCQYQASSYYTLHYHKMTNHLATQERCNICDYNHPHPTMMRQHYKWAHLGIEYKCEQCDFKTKNLLSTMRSHVKTKHSETKETCTDCDYSHPIASKVKAHFRKIHLGIKEERRRKICRREGCLNAGLSTCSESDHFLLYCEHCEFTTSGLEYLKRHLQRYHITIALKSDDNDERLLHSCENCDYKTQWKGTLSRHVMNNHMNEETKQILMMTKKCTYETCSFKTKESVRLKRHIESKHEGIIHYRCKYMNCAYVADDIKGLRDHTGTHEAMFKCNSCKKYFARSRNLKHHIKAVHEFRD